MAVGIAKGVEITSVGCPFYNRCPMGIEGTCEQQPPPVRDLEDGHQISCHRTIEELVEAESETQQILRGYEKLVDESLNSPA